MVAEAAGELPVVTVRKAAQVIRVRVGGQRGAGARAGSGSEGRHGSIGPRRISAEVLRADRTRGIMSGDSTEVAAVMSMVMGKPTTAEMVKGKALRRKRGVFVQPTDRFVCCEPQTSISTGSTALRRYVLRRRRARSGQKVVIGGTKDFWIMPPLRNTIEWPTSISKRGLPVRRGGSGRRHQPVDQMFQMAWLPVVEAS